MKSPLECSFCMRYLMRPSAIIYVIGDPVFLNFAHKFESKLSVADIVFSVIFYRLFRTFHSLPGSVAAMNDPVFVKFFRNKFQPFHRSIKHCNRQYSILFIVNFNSLRSFYNLHLNSDFLKLCLEFFPPGSKKWGTVEVVYMKLGRVKWQNR